MPDDERYEIRVDGAVAGTAEYVARPGLKAFTHTRVGSEYGGQGLAGKLVARALDDAQAAGEQVLPFCTYVNRYIARHPEYVELVPPEQRSRFDL